MAELLSLFDLRYENIKLEEQDGRIIELPCTKGPVTIESKLLTRSEGFTLGRDSANSPPDLAITERDTETSRRQGRIYLFAGRLYYEDSRNVILPAGLRDNKGDSYICVPGIQKELFPGDAVANNRAYLAFGHGPRKPLHEILQWPEYLSNLPVKIGQVPRHVVKLTLERKL